MGLAREGAVSQCAVLPGHLSEFRALEQIHLPEAPDGAPHGFCALKMACFPRVDPQWPFQFCWLASQVSKR